MIIPVEATTKYGAEHKLLLAAQDKIKQIVGAFCDARGYAIASRCKTLKSILEKIEGGQYKSWEQLDDLVAFSIIIPSLQEEPDVLTFLQTVFSIHEIKKRGESSKAPDVFRFDLTRVICSINDGSDISKIKCEVQIRTALEHAWSSATHKIVYKADDVSWSKQRLAAQIKAGVEQLDLLLNSFQISSETLQESPHKEIKIKARMLEKFTSWFARGHLPSELKPSSFRRIVDNVYELLLRFKFQNSKYKLEQGYLSVLDAVEAKIVAASSARLVPTSLSFFQIFLFYAADSGEITMQNLMTFANTNNEAFFIHVTKSLCDLKNDFSQIANKFDYQN